MIKFLNKLGSVIVMYVARCFVPKQKAKEITCVLYGHKWSTSFSPNAVDGKKTKERTYCTRCHVFHNDPLYISTAKANKVKSKTLSK